MIQVVAGLVGTRSLVQLPQVVDNHHFFYEIFVSI